MISPYIAARIVAVSPSAAEKCFSLIDASSAFSDVEGLSDGVGRWWRERGLVEIADTQWTSQVAYIEHRASSFISLDQKIRGLDLYALLSSEEESVISLNHMFSSLLYEAQLVENDNSVHFDSCEFNLDLAICLAAEGLEKLEVCDLEVSIDDSFDIRMSWQEPVSIGAACQHILSTFNRSLYERASPFSLSENPSVFHDFNHEPNKAQIVSIGFNFSGHQHQITNRGIVFLDNKMRDINHIRSDLIVPTQGSNLRLQTNRFSVKARCP